MRAADRRSRSRATAWVHLLGAFALLVSLLGPWVVPAADAQRAGNQPPPLPTPYRVAALGYFQTALGCPADYDPTCPLSDLTDNGDGTWSAYLAIPAGEWSMQILHQSDRDRTLGVDGIPDGPEIPFSVPADAPATYVSYSTHTGEVVIVPAATSVQLVTDLGQTIAMRPKKKGGFRATFDGQPGQYGFQVVVNGQPVAQDSLSLDDAYRVVVDVDESGQVTVKDILQDAKLVVQRSDGDGVPQPDACFAVIDPQQNDKVLSQACDGDDQNPDGQTTLRFLDGVDRGQYELVETFTPEGQSASETQRIEIGPGKQSASAVVGAGAPTDGQSAAPGQVTITVVGGRGKPLAFACFQIAETGQEACDDDGDGTIVIDGVPAGTYTLIETAAPEGRDQAPTQTIEVTPEGAAVTVVHEGGAVPDAGTEQGATPGSVAITAIDEFGTPILDTCFTLTSQEYGEQQSACDADDGSDGLITFPMLKGGIYDLAESATPAGLTPPASQQVEVVPGEEAAVQVIHQAQAEVGTLVISVMDDTGAAIGGACFDITGPAQLLNICDEGDDGELRFTDLPAGDYTITQVAAAEGRALADPVTVTIPAGDAARVAIENPAADTPQPDGPRGTVVIRALGYDDLPIGGGCYGLFGATTIDVCDGDGLDLSQDAGVIRLEDVPAGAYDIFETRAPAGVEPGGANGLQVDPDATVRVTFRPGAVPEIGTGDVDSADLGGLLLTVTDDQGLPVAGACITLDGPTPAANLCDTSDGDGDPTEGTIAYDGMQPGTYTLTVTAPEGYQAPAPVEVTIEAGVVTPVGVALTQGDGTGTLIITATGPDGSLAGGACFNISGPAAGSSCDDASTDADATPGILRLEGMPAGEYQISPGRAPIGYAGGDAQTVVVPSGGEVNAIVVFAPAAGGNILVSITRQQGLDGPVCVDSLNGAVPGTPVCDGDPADGDPTGDRILITNVPPGDYGVMLTTTPEGSAYLDAQPVTVISGETAEVAFALIREGAVVGDLTILAETADGTLLPGGCYTITNPESGVQIGPVCDDDGTGDVVVTGLDAGTWTITESSAPTGSGPADESTIAVRIKAGEQASAIFRNAAAGGIGDLVITVSDEAGNLLPNSCVTLTEEATGQTSEEFCDRGDDGILSFPELASGKWLITLTRVARGFAAGGPTAVTIVPAQETTLAIVLKAEDASASPTPTEPENPNAQPTAIPEVSEPGSMRITAVDAFGAPIGIGGECYDIAGVAAQSRICDESADDVDPTPGTIQIDGLPAGSYTVTQSRAPEGYALAALVRAEVLAQSVTEVYAASDPAPVASGSITISALGPDGAPLPNACFAVIDASGIQVGSACDGDPDDAANKRGVITIEGIPAGPVTIEQVAAPDGFTAAEAVVAEVVGDADVAVDMTMSAIAPDAGEATFQAFDEDGQIVLGQCFTLTQGEGDLGQFCDGDANDPSGQDGVVTVAGLAAGEYQVIAQPAATGDPVADEELAQQARADARAFTLRRGEARTDVKVNVRRQATNRGNVLVSVRNERNEPLSGACLAFTDARGNLTEICDNDANDGDVRVGQILFADQRSGDGTLSQTAAPRGYDVAADQIVKIRGGATRQASVIDQPTRARTGVLTITTVDGAGTPIAGACYLLVSGTSSIGPACDADTGADGITTFGELPGGAYIVRMTTAPAGYGIAGDTAVRILAGETTQTTVTLTARTGSLEIRTTSPSGALLAGACYDAIATSGTAAYSVCDNDQNDGSPTAGIILLRGIMPTTYAVVQTRPPGGYLAAPEGSAVVAPGQRAVLNVTNQPMPAPVGRGDLVVTKTDPSGALLSGACWAVIDGDVIVAGPVCDESDGVLDGVSRFVGIPAGDFLLRETRRPSANYAFAADQPVSIIAGRITRTSVVNSLVNGRVLVQKTDPNGQPLAGACFDLDGDPMGEVCTDASGNALFTDVAPGTYLLRETVTPAGFVTTAPVKSVRVNPAATTVIAVVNRPLPPPANSGSLQIVKFICPAGEQGAFTSIFDSSDGTGEKLGLTAGCVRGDAGFTLESYAGTFAPAAFRTGTTGQYQVTLPAGGYLLTETDPVLGGETAEELFVSANQLTTVVVLNFVPPPPPAPASLTITARTCAPGLQGVVYADFANGCLEAGTLTNNLEFRLTGMVSGRQTTGDSGIQGVTAFIGLPAGPYRLREELPATPAQSVTMFCGKDPAAPTLIFHGQDARLDLAVGDAMTCQVFNVPDPVNPTTGTIAVHAYACAITTPPPGYDWFSWCASQGAGVRFAVSYFNGETFVPKATGATDASGTIRFTDAPPGTYQVKEIGANWCHAQSDSVDASGNIVVKAGQRANVWIFNCVGATTPPNTGSGQADALIDDAVAIADGLEPIERAASPIGVSPIAPRDVIMTPGSASFRLGRLAA